MVSAVYLRCTLFKLTSFIVEVSVLNPPLAYLSVSPAIPLLMGSPSFNPSALPDNLDQVVSTPVIDNIIGLFFDYVSRRSNDRG